MDEEKFSPVEGNGKSEKKGFKIKVITLLFIAIIIVICSFAVRSLIMNNKRKLNEKIASATVEYELNKIKVGDEEALEKYLNYGDILNNSDEVDEIEEEIESGKEDDEVKTETATEEVENEENDRDEEERIFKSFLSSLNYEITDVNVENNSATVTTKISNKNSGEIFRNYFTRAIKLAINQALSTTQGNEGNLEKELQEYLEEQVTSDEIPIVTNEVKFSLEKENNNWIVKSQDKEMVDVVFPGLMDTIAELGEEYGEYGD